ncbi:hypothetical protein BC827DRAFT_1267307 [Russula dissimulans]|nr:hypothetical protein BC827DRAFT_1267307 [Russula dissimulans]
MSSPQASDILVDGFISHTFSPQDAHIFFSLVLRTPDFLRLYRILYWKEAWYIMQNLHSDPRLEPSLGFPKEDLPLPLDFSVRTTQGTVVPQQRWTPSEVDFSRHVEGAVLQLPIFFVNGNGGVGFWLPDILQGRFRGLCNGDREAPLGGKTTTHIRINWPGYHSWKRQIPTRDETRARNPITLARFMKYVAVSLDKFIDQCTANGHHVVDPRWGIGTHGITQSHIKVIGAVHVSAGSWMPIIQLTGHRNQLAVLFLPSNSS